jgi:hypothetical protein
MDDHFSKILAPSHSASQLVAQHPFILSVAFQGRKTNYKYQRGSKGVGYYFDRVQAANGNAEEVLQNERVHTPCRYLNFQHCIDYYLFSLGSGP